MNGGLLNVDDYTRLRSLAPGTVHWQEAGLTRSQFAGMLGNGMSANVLEFLIPCGLHAAGFLGIHELNNLQRTTRARWSS